MKQALAIVALALLLGACRGDVKEDTGAPVEDRKPAPSVQTPPQKPTPPPPAIVSQPTPTKTTPPNPLRDPGSILSKRSVYFDYDSTVVKDEFKPLVTAHAKYLSDNRNRKIVVQGNTDERGSREYNIALGQRRADSVKKMMLLLGVRDNQIETVSFGEEKPRANGSDEAAYAENRRSDIVYDSE
jgi:peptidoglycan-associated lipoprotein